MKTPALSLRSEVVASLAVAPHLQPLVSTLLITAESRGGVMDQKLPSLDALGLKFGTDKSSKVHDYLSFYESFLEPMRHDRPKILEIGVLFGASLRMWEEYFPNGIVVGVDLDPGITIHSTPRILTEVIDQSNLEDLVQLGIKHGPFDVVIEDGSHLWEHQITTLRTMLPFVTNGGFYIIEDLHTNFGNIAPQYRGSSTISCIEYLKKLVDLRVADDQIDIFNEEDPFLRTYGRNIQFLTFYKRACIIRKKYSAGISLPDIKSIADDPLAKSRNTDVQGHLSLICHVGGLGNMQSFSGALTVLRDDVNIQGFVILGKDSISRDLKYRALLSDGSWTEWVACGHFVGTMGRSQDLTGFSARLTGHNKKSYNLELLGRFRGHADPVVVPGGGDCISQDAHQLYGLQIVIRSRR